MGVKSYGRPFGLKSYYRIAIVAFLAFVCVRSAHDQLQVSITVCVYNLLDIGRYCML